MNSEIEYPKRDISDIKKKVEGIDELKAGQARLGSRMEGTKELVEGMGERVKAAERKDSLPSRKILDGINPRIEELSKLALQEEGEGQMPLSEDSRRGLLNFLKRVSDSGIEAVPELALTYGGNIVAEWESSPDEVLSLEFLDSSSLKFVFFYQCSDLADKILRISGSGSVSGFLEDHRRALKFLEGINPDD